MTSDNTTIEWTNASWNPTRGCSIVSEGCRNCYAMRQAHRQSTGAYQGLTRLGAHGPTWTGEVRFVPEVLDHPLRVRKPKLIFVDSMSDVFHPGVSDDQIDQIFAVMRRAHWHTFQVLTKRPERMLQYLTTANHTGATAESRVRKLAPANTPRHWYHMTNWHWPLPNVWLIVSVEDQPTADQRTQLLLQTPAAVRGVSVEPLLAAVDLDHRNLRALTEFRRGTLNGAGAEILHNRPRLDWVIVGGESGAGARPMHPEWVRSLRDQCVRAGVPFFFKQWGSWFPADQINPRDDSGLDVLVDCDMGRYKQHLWWKGEPPHQVNDETSFLVGKKAAGNLLDGRVWQQMPAGVKAPKAQKGGE